MSSGLPEGWEYKPLSNFVLEHRGGAALTPSDFSNSGFPVIPKKAIQFGAKVILGNDKTFCKLEFAENNLSHIVDCNFVISTLRDLVPTGPSIGLICELKEKSSFILAQGVYGFRLNDQLNPSYLSYISNVDWYRSIMRTIFVGSTQIHIRTGDFLDVILPIPPLPEQEKIAAVLGAVDDVIEKTALQIKKLNDLKKSTMNELLTKGIGHTDFKPSELGQIPKSWEVKKLGLVAKIERGKFSHRPRSDPAFFGGRTPFIQTGEIPKSSIYIEKHSQTLNEKGVEVSRVFSKGTLVMTIAANIGEVGILKFDSAFPDSLVGLCPNSNYSSIFLLFCLRHSYERLDELAPKTAQRNLNLEILNEFLVAVPPLPEQKQIASILDSISTQIEKVENKLSSLNALKKSLMQDLLSGKVRVKVS